MYNNNYGLVFGDSIVFISHYAIQIKQCRDGRRHCRLEIPNASVLYIELPLCRTGVDRKSCKIVLLLVFY